MKVISLLVTISLWLIFTSNVSAQFGVRLKYDLNQYSNWNNALKERFSTTEALYPSSYGIGVNHWFRLKKKRIEFCRKSDMQDLRLNLKILQLKNSLSIPLVSIYIHRFMPRYG